MIFFKFFSKAKSKYFTYTFSWSISSSSNLPLSGFESVSSASNPSESVISVISAVLTITLCSVVIVLSMSNSLISNTTFISLYDGLFELNSASLSKAFIKLFSEFSFDNYVVLI